MNRVYLMEHSFLEQLREDRKELLSVARSFKTAEEMRSARAELMASLPHLNITPANAEAAAKSYQVDENGVAHIPIIGELTPAAEKDACGAYTAQALTEYGFIIAATEAAGRDKAVSSIQYHVNSPGGYVDGVAQAGNAIRMVGKPTVALVGDMAASAAYWLASQADKITASSIASRVGSIGVAAEELDNTEMLKGMGIQRRVYHSTDAPDKRPDTSTKEGQAKVVAMLDDLHSVFVKTVAEGRGVSVEDINQNYGRGGVLIAEKAMKAGMIDEIMTYNRDNAIGVADHQTAARAEKHEEGVMDFNISTLEKEHPDVFAEAVQIGIKQERERITELQSYTDADPENTKLAEVVNAAIADGQNATQITAKLQVAIRDGKQAGENPPHIDTSANLDPLSDEDLEAAKLAGMTAEEYRQYSKMEV
jgi:ClpP class serine protease